MKRSMRIVPMAFFLPLIPWLATAETVIHHQLLVKLSPATGQLQVSDTITVPPAKGPLRFSLHSGFSLTSLDSSVSVEPDPGTDTPPDYRLYRVSLPEGRSELTVDYQGKITSPLQDLASGIGRDQKNSLGFISPESVYLDGNSHWYPQFGDELVTFSITVEIPSAWLAVSQGRYTARQPGKMTLEEVHPQEEIYLLAAPYHAFSRKAGSIDTEVLLHSDDPVLANQYLSVIPDYLDMYSRLLGPYPYSKFDVVENSWESGYGMPSFTLLGPRVMRLPFILRSSLPHEILHNWWGNGVYVDYSQGNWSEGLTAYLADHLLREQVGEGGNYRRNALLRYTNYVSEHNDFPLKDFQGRHSEATQAVGYDKALMVFHMLRLQLGGQDFIKALRNFFQAQQFHRASWDDLRRSFESVGHTSLRTEFEQWLTRRGAPSLHVQAARTERTGDHYVLTARVEQTQPGPAYTLRIPFAVQLDGQERAWQTVVEMKHKQQTVQLNLPARPWRLDVDPEFDVFRRLEPGELPPTLSEAFGADSLLMVLPATAPAPVRNAYRHLAQAWSDASQGIEVRWDKDLQKLPTDRAVWLFGWENRFLDGVISSLKGQMTLSDHAAVLNGQSLQRSDHSVVLTARQGGPSGPIRVWLGSDNPAAFPGLARKLPHYGSYSYLAFQGDEPTNMLKGQWRVLDSPLNIAVQQPDHATPPAASLKLRPRTALIAADSP